MIAASVFARRASIALSSLALFILSTAHAQDRLDPVAMGKARASVASVRGLGAVTSNPGALDFDPTSRITLTHPFTFSIYSVGGTFGSTYLSGSEFRELFGTTSTANRQRMADLIREDEKLFANAAISLLTLRYETESSGTFGLHYGHRVFARVNFPADLAQLVATLNIAGQDFRFTNEGMGGDWVTELSASYGKKFGSDTRVGWFPTVGVGATVKLLQGVAHFDLAKNSLITIDQIEVLGRLGFHVRGGFIFRSATPDGFDPGSAISDLATALFPATAGTGFGFDAGLSGVLYRMPGARQGAPAKDALYFGIALQDVGSVVWKTNALERRMTDIDDTIPSANLTIQQLEQYQGTLTRVPEYSTPLPSVLRTGIAMNVGAFAPDLDGSLIVDVEGELPLNDVPGNLFDPRVAIGADWGLSDAFSVRAGVSAGGIRGMAIGLGVGFRPAEWLSIDLGSGDVNGIFSGKRVDFAARIAFGLGER